MIVLKLTRTIDDGTGKDIYKLDTHKDIDGYNSLLKDMLFNMKGSKDGEQSKIFYSPRIKEIIDFMSVYHTEHQCFPKLDEIGKALNLQKQRVGIL